MRNLLSSSIKSLATQSLPKPIPISCSARSHPFSVQAVRKSIALEGTRTAPIAPTKYGGVYTVTLIPGDGIGKEITNSVKEIFEHTNAPIEFEEFNVSGETSESQSVFQRSMDSLRRNRVGLKGVLYTPSDDQGHPSWNVAMRQQLDIYASISLCKSVPGYPTRHKGVDFAIIRENTEGEYSGLEHSSVPGVVESLKIISRSKSERIARFALTSH